jgi:hypothetical protein
MPGSALRVLQNSLCAKGLDHRRDLLGLVPYDDNLLLRAQRRARADNMLEERAPPRAVQNLGKAGFQPRAFSRGENNNGQIVIGHEGSILASLPRLLQSRVARLLHNVFWT